MTGGQSIAGIVILAGGTAVRLGGVSKPDYEIGGRRLIDILFDELAGIGFRGRAVVVAPHDVAVADDVVLTLEDPPHGGPLAGIGAGVDALAQLGANDLVALATCDAPLAVRLLPELMNAIDESDAANPASRMHGAVPVDADGWRQFTHGVYRMGALRSRHYQRDRSVRFGFRDLALADITDPENLCLDVDTPGDAQELAKSLAKVEK